MLLGLDFDNTIAGYDRLFAELAREAGLLAAAPADKRALRDRLRRQAGGEIAWQRLQATAYGPRMGEAELIDGFAGFMAACRHAGAAAVIVSHKSERSHIDPAGPNLRECALGWMRAHGFFDPARFAFKPDEVFFEATREEKIARIVALGCTHFVDDLEEVFADTVFPRAVHGYLLAPDAGPLPANVTHCRSWADVGGHLFGAEARVAAHARG